ncbi:MAG: ScpA family protein, partial [Pseudomonadota bacterium]
RYADTTRFGTRMSARFDIDNPPDMPANDGGQDGRVEPGEQLIIDLDGFEGPIDLMLALARDKKLDITGISMVALADQYLAFIDKARSLRLELAADYLVMAAWLAYLKSRLLLPPEEEATADEPTGEELAAALAFQLKRLESIQKAAKLLTERPYLHYERQTRGAAEDFQVINNPIYDVGLYDILRAYGDIQQRQQAQTYRPVQARLFSVEDALKRLRQSLGSVPGWVTLQSLLPSTLGQGLSRRSAVASTFLASLELAKGGNLEIQQATPFAPIRLRWRDAPADADRGAGATQNQ